MVLPALPAAIGLVTEVVPTLVPEVLPALTTALEASLATAGTEIVVSTAAGTVVPGVGNAAGFGVGTALAIGTIAVGVGAAAYNYYHPSKPSEHDNFLAGHDVNKELAQKQQALHDAANHAKSGEPADISAAKEAQKNYDSYITQLTEHKIAGFDREKLTLNTAHAANEVADAVASGWGPQFKKFEEALKDNKLTPEQKHQATEKYLAYLNTLHNTHNSQNASVLPDTGYEQAVKDAKFNAKSHGVDMDAAAPRPGTHVSQPHIATHYQKDPDTLALQALVVKEHPELVEKMGPKDDGLFGPKMRDVSHIKLDAHGIATKDSLAQFYKDNETAITGLKNPMSTEVSSPQTGTLTQEAIVKRMSELYRIDEAVATEVISNSSLSPAVTEKLNKIGAEMKQELSVLNNAINDKIALDAKQAGRSPEELLANLKTIDPGIHVEANAAPTTGGTKTLDNAQQQR
jgi:hypothetical protein